MLKNLAKAKAQIIETSRLAGVAGVATSIIHNAGNLLNSINVSVSLLQQSTESSKTTSLVNLYNILYENKNNLQYFLEKDDRGKLLLPYFEDLIKAIDKERLINENETGILQNKLAQINQIVTQQLSVNNILGVIDQVNISELFEQALSLQNTKIIQYAIKITCHYSQMPPILTIRSKLHQILVNLIKNSVESLIEKNDADKELILSLEILENECVRIKVKDNGMGVLQENLDQIFSFGFTTKVDGHGYGLHDCALLAIELKGKLSVESAGFHQGATFILDIPKSYPVSSQM